MNDSTKTNPNELLVTAVNDGNLDKVKEYLENGCSLHKKEDTLKSCFLTVFVSPFLTEKKIECLAPCFFRSSIRCESLVLSNGVYKPSVTALTSACSAISSATISL